MKILKIIASSFLLMVVFAGAANASGLTNTSTITQITPGSASVRVSGLTGNPDACGEAGLYVLLYDNTRSKELYAGLLTAYASGANVQLFVNGCVDDGPKNLAEIKSIILK